MKKKVLFTIYNTKIKPNYFKTMVIWPQKYRKVRKDFLNSAFEL